MLWNPSLLRAYPSVHACLIFVCASQHVHERLTILIRPCHSRAESRVHPEDKYVLLLDACMAGRILLCSPKLLCVCDQLLPAVWVVNCVKCPGRHQRFSVCACLVLPLYLSGSITSKTGNTMDCDFEPDTCLWQHVRGNVLYWRLRQGRTPSFGTGPGQDHTFKNSSGKFPLLFYEIFV